MDQLAEQVFALYPLYTLSCHQARQHTGTGWAPPVDPRRSANACLDRASPRSCGVHSTRFPSPRSPTYHRCAQR